MTLLALTLVLLQVSRPPVPPSGEAIVRAAYARFAGRWPRTMTYVQQTEDLGTERPQTWYTALELPGRMRVDIAPMGVGRALITRGDSSWGYGAGQLRSVMRQPNPLLLLVHDLHTQPPERTIATLKALGFDLTRSRDDNWLGRPMLVVGAREGDSVSNQFWLDRERMIVVRMLYNRRALEVRIAQYRKVGGGWVEGAIETWNKGQLVRVQKNTDVKVGVKHEPGLFDPSNYKVPKWVGQLVDSFGKVPPIPPGGPGRGGRSQ